MSVRDREVTLEDLREAYAKIKQAHQVIKSIPGVQIIDYVFSVEMNLQLAFNIRKGKISLELYKDKKFYDAEIINDDVREALHKLTQHRRIKCMDHS